MSLGGFAVLYMDLLNPFLGANIYSLYFTQWSRQEKDDSLSVFEIYSPSKVIDNQFHSPREKYFVTPFPSNGARRCCS
jgi:hypothetical protein